MTNAVLLVARILVVALFLWSGFGKLMNPGGVTGAIAAKGLPAAQILAYLTIAAELGLGLLIAAGLYARAAAVALAAFTAMTIVFFHNFWTMTGDAVRMNQIQALKNVSIIGALLIIAAVGPGRFAVNQR
ncbi:DoxX family protein [Methylobacterium sp. ID0610]|uniref:DoxX family protein n=1 Tax=Methylobacterium carpenticola TaxID=3344827 RepID=UPI0036A0D92B